MNVTRCILCDDAVVAVKEEVGPWCALDVAMPAAACKSKAAIAKLWS